MKAASREEVVGVEMGESSCCLYNHFSCYEVYTAGGTAI